MSKRVWWLALVVVCSLGLAVGCGKKGPGGDDDDDDDDNIKYGDPDPPGPCAVFEPAPIEVTETGMGWVVVHHCELGSCAAGNKQNDIWIAATDGSGEVRELTTNAADSGTFVDNRFLDLTPDAHIIYSSKLDSAAIDYELRVVDLDGNDTLLATGVSYYGGQTPSGKLIFMRGLGPDQTIDPDRDLYSVDMAGNEVTLAATASVDEYLASLLDGDDLVYSSASGPADGVDFNIGDLYFVRADGTGNVQLSNEAGREDFAGMTPSGRIVYTNIQVPAPAPADPIADIYSIRSDGSDKITVANAVDQEIAAAVAGEYVVIQYIIMVPTMDPNVKIPQYDLLVANADGTGAAVIANNDANNETLATVSTWCTTIYTEVRYEQVGMDSIAFTKAFGYDLENGGAPYELDDTGDSSFDLYYSSNGKKIFYNRGGTDAYVVNEDASEKLPLAQSGDTESIVDLVLDQKRAIYLREGANGDAFHSVSIDGSDDQELAPELAGVKMYYGRAGNHIVMTFAETGSSNGDVISVPAAGGDTLTLASSDDLEIPAAMLPNGNVVYTRFRGSFGNDLFIVPADGSIDNEPLVEESGDDRFATFIP